MMIDKQSVANNGQARQLAIKPAPRQDTVRAVRRTDSFKAVLHRRSNQKESISETSSTAKHERQTALVSRTNTKANRDNGEHAPVDTADEHPSTTIDDQQMIDDQAKAIETEATLQPSDDVVAPLDDDVTELMYDLMATVQQLLTQLTELNASDDAKLDNTAMRDVRIDVIQVDVQVMSIKQQLLDTEQVSQTTPTADGSAQRITAEFESLIEALTSLVNTVEGDHLTGESDAQQPIQALLGKLNGQIERLEKHIEPRKPVVTAETLSVDINDDDRVKMPIGDRPTADESLDEEAFAKSSPSDDQTLRLVKDDKRSNADAKQVFDASTAPVDVVADKEAGAVKADNRTIQTVNTMKTQVFDQVKTAIIKTPVDASEHSEMIIKLKPEELGKVELKIEVHNDNVIAKFNVASQMVKEAIESNLEDLRNSLKDKGFSEMAFNVDVKKDNDGQTGYRQHQRRRRGVITTLDAEKRGESYIKSLSAMINDTTFEHLA